jgi:hypothetical protein
MYYELLITKLSIILLPVSVTKFGLDYRTQLMPGVSEFVGVEGSGDFCSVDGHSKNEFSCYLKRVYKKQCTLSF